MRIRIITATTLAALVLGARLRAQAAVTRQQAIDSALAHLPRVAVARGELAVAAAERRLAGAYPNPTAAASYSRSVPRYHATVDIPLEYPWIRAPRVEAAMAAREAARYRLAFAQALARCDAETTYARALAAAEHARIARENARDADSLLHMAARRRDAGDASELDVRLAAVNAGQLANAAADDSLASVLALLDLQRIMGLADDRVTIALADTLALPPSADPPATVPLPVQAARADLQAAERALIAERRSVFGVPALELGVEAGDPTGAEPGLLPVVGISIPLPVFDRHRGAIALAAAAEERSRAAVAAAAQEAEAVIARAYRQRAMAVAKAVRDRALVASAEQVARGSLTAYAEGAAALPSVLEAQRNARTILLQYVDDLAAAAVADALVRLYAATSTGS